MIADTPGGRETEIFLDTANLDEIRRISAWGIISGLTTNQKILLREKGVDFRRHMETILSMVDGPVSVEVTSSSLEEFIEEAREYASWGSQVVIKIPMYSDGRGLEAVSILEKEGIRTNMTALMSPNQVLLAAQAGATYASIFFRRIRDYGDDPERVITQSRQLLDWDGSKTRIIAGSIRDPMDVVQAGVAGAHIVTIPYKILVQMPMHPKTEETIAEFDRAWEEFRRASVVGAAELVSATRVGARPRKRLIVAESKGESLPLVR